MASPDPAPGRQVCLVVNPSAGGGRASRVLGDVEVELARLGVRHTTERTRSLTHACELVRAAAQRGDTVVTLSGDGMVGAAAGVLRDVPGSVLGVLPGGRGNDFARVLGVPLDAVQACQVIADGRPRRVDVGEAGGRTFIGIASVGFDSDANRIANQAPAWLGQGVYAYGALRALAAWRPATFELELDGAGERVVGYSVGAANSKAYGGGMFVAPGAELDDGLLDVVWKAHTPRLRFLRDLPKVFDGTHVESPSVTVRRAREVRISADRPFAIYADGDPIAELPVTVRAVPAALTVLAPRVPAPTATPGHR